VGLIAREIERAGVPTLAMTSAWDITAAVNPPRALYLDFPLGHTTGKPGDRALQRAIVTDALRAFERLREPGTIEALPYEWAADDAWKDRVMRPRDGAAADDADAYEDDRVERFDTPQYQCERDRELAEAALAEGRCETCVWVES
jgi:hypothetical protein